MNKFKDIYVIFIHIGSKSFLKIYKPYTSSIKGIEE